MAENAEIKMFTMSSEARGRLCSIFAAISRIAADAEPYTPDYNCETIRILRGLLNTADWLNRELDAVHATPERKGVRLADPADGDAELPSGM